VLTLDIEMPKIDGITFLPNLMRLRPMPVVMISTLTLKAAPATLDALAIGAVDYVAKPQGNAWGSLNSYSEVLKEKVRNAAGANLSAYEKIIESRPDDIHLEVKERGGHLVTFLNDIDKVNGHKPSIDILFILVVKYVGKYAEGVILTGMCDDGAQGLKDILDAGGGGLRAR
jgi:chemotaxis response regulator CheB